MSWLGDLIKDNGGAILEKGLDLIPSGNNNQGSISATQMAQPKSNMMYYILGGIALFVVLMMGNKRK